MNLFKVTPAFAEALVKMQGELEGAKKRKANPGFRSKYADLESCWEACGDALQTNNLAVLQFPSGETHGMVGLRTCLVYGPTGEVLEESYALPIKDPTNPQAGGSAITYLRRYGLCAALGICPEDDDGNAAAAKERAAQPKAEVNQLRINETMRDFVGLNALEDMKSYYSKVKNEATLDDETKTALLQKMAAVIKERL